MAYYSDEVEIIPAAVSTSPAFVRHERVLGVHASYVKPMFLEVYPKLMCLLRQGADINAGEPKLCVLSCNHGSHQVDLLSLSHCFLDKTLVIMSVECAVMN